MITVLINEMVKTINSAHADRTPLSAIPALFLSCRFSPFLNEIDTLMMYSYSVASSFKSCTWVSKIDFDDEDEKAVSSR